MLAKVLLLYLCIFQVLLINTSFFCYANTGNSSIDDESREDTGESNDDTKDTSIEILAEKIEPSNNQVKKQACTRKQNNLMHEIRKANPEEFPFMAAIMSSQNEILCSGVVVSNGMILTSKQCSSEPIEYVLLNTTDDKKKDNFVSFRVLKTDKYPTPAGGDIDRNVALLYTEKHNNTVASKIKLSNYTDQKAITDFEAFGYGLNANIGQSKELQYIGLENRDLEPGSHIKGYFDCVDTKIPTCFKNTGGPAIFGNELIGIVTNGRDNCLEDISSQFAINDKIVDVLPIYVFKPWLEEQIQKNEESKQMALVTYPSKPVLRESLHKMTSSSTKYKIGIQHYQCLLLCLFLLF